MANKEFYYLKKVKMLNSTITNKVTSILVPEYNGKENPEGSYTKKYQKDIVAVMAII